MANRFKENKVSEEYPSLFHYTTFESLEGILATDSLWATHFKYLNDTTEFRFAIPWVIEKVSDVMRPNFIEELESRLNDESDLARLKQLGGPDAVLRHDIESALKSMLSLMNNEGYVFSFCAHKKQNHIDNGMLSMWRAYAPNGGVAIEFNSKAIEEQFKSEYDKYEVFSLGLADVVYSDQTALIADTFTRMIRKVAISFARLFRGLENKTDVDTKIIRGLPSFIQLLTRYKHWAFSDENEVRLVMMPVSVDEDYLGLTEGDEHEFKLNKPRKVRLRSGHPVSYIELLADYHGPLPITKIIVGPHRSKHEDAEALRRELGARGIEVVVSDIPYISAS